jgi:hypothetical protein
MHFVAHLVKSNTWYGMRFYLELRFDLMRLANT